MKKTMLLWGLAMLLSLSASAGKKNEAQIRKVYFFGFASSFTDTLAYMTDIQVLDSACILPKGLLADRLVYSFQLENFVTSQRGLQNATVATFFNVKPKKIQKKFMKVKQRYKDNPNLVLIQLPKEEFAFRVEEDYVGEMEVSEEGGAE